MLRFATTPTSDMHTGDLRVALLNYIVSKQKDEDFIVRIEDLDKEKNIEGKDKEIFDILNLFKIEYSQTIYQSESVRFHTAMALQLMHEKQAFSCFCSSDWLQKKREEAKEAKKPYKYDDACRDLPHELVIDNTSPFSIRIKSDSNDLDSFTIMSQKKKPTYNFACGVDDMLSNISLVICEKDKANNTHKQQHIRASLGYKKTVEFVYVPTLVGENLSIKSLLESGFLPEAISNYLISIGNKTPKEIFTTNEAIEWFDVSKISDSPVPFDINILRDINHKHLKNLDAKELSRYVGFADEEIGNLARVYLQEVSTTKELKAKITSIFSTKEIPEEFFESAKTLTQAIKNTPYFEDYAEFKDHLIKETLLDEKNFLKLLRYLLTGAENGPDIAIIYKYLKNYIGEIVK